MTHPIGVLIMGTFFTTWIFSSLCTILAIPLWLLLGVSLPVKLLVAYFTLRLFGRAPSVPSLHRFLALCIEKYPYFASQQLVFESPRALPMRSSATLLAVFPHGVTCVGWSVNLNLSSRLQEAGIVYLAADFLMKVPIISDALFMFSSDSASKESLIRHMKRRENLALLPGGFDEAAILRKGRFDVFLNDRKGFIKYALQYGYAVSPVYSFGDELAYNVVEGFIKERKWLAKQQVPGVLFWSKWLWLPDPSVSVVTVVGDPVQFVAVENPTPDEVDKAHAQFVKALQALFDKYKGQYAADPDAKLVIH
ncbi:diacylglycerol acyltransferase-domain-containing protein [Chytriomyces sp. MP71]|nr:diacylglycerol acyltransferase-domain-containing protein [Chytriomyces sp. MP71]